MLLKKAPDIRESEVTPQSWHARRREFLKVAGSTAVAVATGATGPFFEGTSTALAQNPAAQKLENLKKSPFNTDEKLNPYRDVTTYNNFYEFGLDKGDPGALRRHAQAAPVEGRRRRAVRQARFLRHRRHHEVVPARGAHLSDALRRGLVHGDSLGRLSAGGFREALRADLEGQVRRVHDASGHEADAGSDRARTAVAVRGRAADGRGDAPAGDDGGRALRRGSSEPERRADSARRAVEVRLQGRQVDRPRCLRREPADEHLAADRSPASTASSPT